MKKPINDIISYLQKNQSGSGCEGRVSGRPVGDSGNIYNFKDRDRFLRLIAVWEIVHGIEKKGKNDEMNLRSKWKGVD